MKVYLKRTIAAGHILENKSKDAEWNKNTFGKCNHAIHGHNFLVQVWVDGLTDEDTGMVVNFNEIKNVIDTFDHETLNNIMPTIPTAENLVSLMKDMLMKKLYSINDTITEIRVRIWETENAYAEDIVSTKKDL